MGIEISSLSHVDLEVQLRNLKARVGSRPLTSSREVRTKIENMENEKFDRIIRRIQASSELMYDPTLDFNHLVNAISKNRGYYVESLRLTDERPVRQIAEALKTAMQSDIDKEKHSNLDRKKLVGEKRQKHTETAPENPWDLFSAQANSLGKECKRMFDEKDKLLKEKENLLQQAIEQNKALRKEKQAVIEKKEALRKEKESIIEALTTEKEDIIQVNEALKQQLQDQEPRKECIVCMEEFGAERPLQRVHYRDCNHAQICFECAMQLWSSGNRDCPSCNTQATLFPTSLPAKIFL